MRAITGNINNAFINTNKFINLELYFMYWSGQWNNPDISSGDITGSINVFNNKYDMQAIRISSYSNVNGYIKDLKNLKKLYYVNFYNTGITGSKTDLWNQGANIESFTI